MTFSYPHFTLEVPRTFASPTVPLSWTWISCFTLALGCYFALVCARRLFWHPLAKYPGPLLGRITDWYSVYHAAKGDRFLDFHALHLRYGDIVRFGPNRISVNTPEGLRAIYGTQANTQKSQFYSVFNHFFDTPSTETTINKRDHARKRRLLSMALSEKALKDMEDAVLDNFQEFCNQLEVPSAAPKSTAGTDKSRGLWSPPKDMGEMMNYLTFDIMGSICFGRNLRTLVDSQYRDLIEVIADGAQGLNTVGHMPGILKLRLERLLLPRLIRGLDEYKEGSKNLAEAAMKDHSTSSVGPQNVTTFLINENMGKRDASENLSVPELISETSLLIIAGSDTTSSCLSSTLFHLLNNPATLSSLVTEIDNTFQNVDEIVTGKKLATCSYLRACIDESLRLSPPVGGLMSREVLAGGLQIGKHFFPAGTDIGTPHYALQHSPEIFPNPYAFQPERWHACNGDDGASNPEAKKLLSAFCAFSVGPRGCVGKRMAYMELTTMLARLVWLYDMRLVTSQGAKEATADREAAAQAALRQRERQTTDKFVAHVEGPWVQFRARQR